MSQVEMFDVPAVATRPLPELVAKARRAIGNVFRAGRPCVVAYSGGKDSTAVAHLTLLEAAACKAQGLEPLVVVTSASTRVENPEVEALRGTELARMEAFAKKAAFQLRVEVVVPTLLSTFQVRTLIGRGLPSFPGTRGDCTVDLKTGPMRAARRRLLAELAAGAPEAVTLVGTRYDESIRRERHMRERGDSADEPVRNRDGELVLCPLAHWSTEDVWELIGEDLGNGVSGYTDASDLMRVYAHSGGTSCAVVSDAILEGTKRARGGCGARTGCFVCQMVAEDTSLANMVEFDPSYAYAKPLLRLNALLRNARYDWTTRHWVGRTIRQGFVQVAPDTYSSGFIRTLRRGMLQADHDERERARRADERPRFELIPLDVMIAIDALGSLNGVSEPHAVWAEARAIESGAVRWDFPEVPLTAPQPLPEPRFLYVGREWEDGEVVQGLRNAYFEALTELAPCSPDIRQLPNGRAVWDLETGRGFSVDEEGAEMLAIFESNRLADLHEQWVRHPLGLTSAYDRLLQYGVLNLDHSSLAMHDEVARRTAWKERNGLALNYDLPALLRRSVPFEGLPSDARVAWQHKGAEHQFDIVERLDATLDGLYP